MKSKQELLAAAYAAFNARDIGAALALMHPDVDWPNGMEGGRVHGHSAVREYWERQWTIIDPRVEPIRFEKDEAGQTAVDVHQIVRDLTGRIVSDQIVQHVYVIQDNLIKRMDIKKAAR
jgi:ketosteroid isomerase-like protein